MKERVPVHETPEKRLEAAEYTFSQATDMKEWEIEGKVMASSEIFLTALRMLDEHNPKHVASAYFALQRYWAALNDFAIRDGDVHKQVAMAVAVSRVRSKRLSAEHMRLLKQESPLSSSLSLPRRRSSNCDS